MVKNLFLEIDVKKELEYKILINETYLISTNTNLKDYSITLPSKEVLSDFEEQSGTLFSSVETSFS